MSDSSEMYGPGNGDAIEELLRHAAPRPSPPSEDERFVRKAIHSEWLAVTRKYRVRRGMTRFALAASFLLAIATAFNAWQIDDITQVEVALIAKSHGSIHLLVAQSELRELTGITTITAGQSIRTGDGAGIGFTWLSGGALRIDEDTHVGFIGPDKIFLHSGRVYFDSDNIAAIDANITGRKITIETEFGTVTHLGTQFMTSIGSETMSISVREGEVRIVRDDRQDTAYSGQQFEYAGSGRPNVSNIRSTGKRWRWVESTAPSLDFTGRTTYEFLQWIGRETGLTLVFENPESERIARNGRLVGTIPGLEPRRELEIRLTGEDLDYAIDDASGTLIVSTVNSRN